MARAWIPKSEALKAVRSTRCWAWLNTFNYWVPGTVQRPYAPSRFKPGYVFMEFRPPRPATPFRLAVPIQEVKIEHKDFTHAVPFLHLPELLRLLRTP